MNKKSAQNTSPLQAPAAPTPTIVSVQEHRQATGLFRAEDLDRVLGDPRTQVKGSTREDFALACGQAHKG
jgi:hypothetical protein